MTEDQLEQETLSWLTDNGLNFVANLASAGID
jgi:hypothetical protein